MGYSQTGVLVYGLSHPMDGTMVPFYASLCLSAALRPLGRRLNGG